MVQLGPRYPRGVPKNQKTHLESKEGQDKAAVRKQEGRRGRSPNNATAESARPELRVEKAIT